MPDDKKPPRPPPSHRDYSSAMGRKTPRAGLPSIRIESMKPEREDGTPPPAPGSISNEDLAVKIRDVDKKHDEFATSTGTRLGAVETKVGSIETKVGSVDTKVDKLITMQLDRAQQRELVSFDLERMHGEVRSKQEIAKIEDQTSKLKTRRERNLELVKLAGRALGYLLTGGVLVHLIERC